MLFGVRLRSLFTSRWLALLWAVLVMLTAIQFVGVGGDETAGNGTDGTALANAQQDAISNAL
ncbi:hypothetical protein J3E64_000639 [Sphingobium sp. OAS761]|uniref:hypothetical protein n=1 Tax=Sphingobium sp. OAS761 TaxID=2817901 RepID=UPI00209D842A|nr:hypothetical protein [Sphingobium sp. OAS761]MCP1468968.1 hypothetical protein [Sphingobium sp. OAS761]